MKVRALALCLPVALAALPAMASAQPDAKIVSTGHQGQKVVMTTGPDQLGHYALKINIADLDPASAAGWAQMHARVEQGTAMLCDAAGDSADMKGYYNSGERQCWHDTRQSAQAQMDTARNDARQGKSTAMLEVSARSATLR